MAGSQNRIEYQIGFSVDKTGLEKMQSLFQQISLSAQEPGAKLNIGLQQAAKTATTLDNILAKTYNSDLGTLNVTKFNQELSKSNLNLRQVKTDLSQAGNTGITAYNRLTQAIIGTNQQMKQSSQLLNSMFNSIKNVFKYNISAGLFNNLSSSISQAFEYAKQLDTSLNDIRIVTSKSAENMQNFAKQANEAAKAMGANTLDYTNASLIYYQQGLSDAEVQARAETTIKAANVTGQTGEEVSEQLTAVWNGYKVTAEETELYVDKLAAVAATTAADLEELSVGMSKVASAANAMGVDFDDLNAQIATIVSVTRQAPESVGTALKTIYARMGDLSVEGGTDEFGVSLGKVSEQMQMMGIQILDQKGNLRDMSSIIAEVAQKWEGWTEAQKQAAAVAMAGKRQYNNLIALFDNWDMYTDALNTSTDALGTLQEQQDIYMDSTAAKLKTLKATWQGLWDDAIDEDEINTGIGLITNLVDLFDKLISSFGGGVKSLAGFGAVFASIFNKQISEGITNASHRLDTFRNNLELTKTKNEAFSLSTGQLETEATPQQIGVAEGARAQLEIAQQIYDARVGLSQEEANILITQQKEVGELTTQRTILDEQNKKIAQKAVDQSKITELLNADIVTSEELNANYAERIDKINFMLEAEQEIGDLLLNEVEGYHAAEKVKQRIRDLTKDISDADKQELELAFKNKTNMDDMLRTRMKILSIIKRYTNGLEESLAIAEKDAEIAEKVYQNKVKISNIDDIIKNKELEITQAIENAKVGTNITQQVTSITSALGNMAMAWTSVSTLMDTWNDKEANFGDKMTQTLITLGMTVPLVIGNVKKLGEVFGVSSTLLDVYNAKIGANVAASKAQSLAKEAQTLAEKANSASIEANIASQEAANAIMGKQANSQELLNIAIQKGNIARAANTDAEIADTIAKKAEAKATEEAAIAQNALNSSMLKFPGAWIVLALAAVAGAIVFYENKLKEAREEAHEFAQSAEEIATKTRTEVEANKELMQQFDELKSKYDTGIASKEDLWDVTGKLIEKYDLEGSRLDMLEGKYDKVAEAAKRAQEEQRKQLLLEDKQAVEASGKEVTTQVNSAFDGFSKVQGSDQYVSTVYSGNPADKNYANLTSEAKKIFGENVTITDDDEVNWFLDTSTPAKLSEGIKKLEEWYEIVKKIDGVDSNNAKTVKNLLDTLNNNDALDNFKANQQKTLDDMLSMSGLDLATNQDSFNESLSQLQQDLQWALSEGIIPPDTEIDKTIADYIGTINSSFAKSFIMEQGIKEKFSNVKQELLDYFKTLSPELQEQIANSFNFEMDPEDGIALLKQYQDYFNNIPSENAVAIPVGVQIDANEKILKGKDLDKDTWETLLGSSPQASQILGEDRDAFNSKSDGERLELMRQLNTAIQEQNTLMVEQRDIATDAGENITSYLKDQIESKKEQLEALQEVQKKMENGEIPLDETNLEQVKKDIVEISDEIEQLSGEKHEIEIELSGEISTKNLLESNIGEVITQSDQLLSATEAIGEGWRVAAEDVAQFASAFPELMEDLDETSRLEDGSIQLSKERVNQILQDNQAIIDSNKDIVLQEIDNKLIQLKAEKEFQQKKIDALDEYLNADIDNENAEADATSQIKKAAQDYADTLRKNDLIDDADAVNQAIVNSEDGARGMVTALDVVNKALQQLHTNYANVFVEGATLADLKTSVSSGIRASNNFTGTKNKDYTGDDSVKAAAIAAAQQARDDAAKRLSEIDQEIAQQEAYRSEVLSHTSKANQAAERVKSGQAGKEPKSSKSGGSGKDKKDKDEKKYRDEFDRYWALKKAIDEVDKALEKLDKRKQHTYGWELINVLKQENELLEKQKACYEQLAQAQEAEAAELRGQLGTMGVMFDASGAIINYAEATAQALAAYNEAIQKYNAGLIDETTLGVAEKSFENFKKLLERYDTLYYTEMKETQDKLEEIRTKQIENNLKAWETELKIKIDWNDLKKGWNTFKKEMEEDFRKVFKDLRVDSKLNKKNAKYDKKNLSADFQAIKDVTAEIDKIMAGQGSDMFQSLSEAQEKLKELNEQMQQHAKDLKDEYKQAWDNYLDGIDQVADKLEIIKDRFDDINDELEYQRQLIELLYGEDDYRMMSEYYEAQHKAIINAIDSYQTQVDFWKNRFEESGADINRPEDWTEDQKKYYDNWQSAQKQVNELALQGAKQAKEAWTNSIKQIIEEEQKMKFGGKSMDEAKLQWERLKEDSDNYYDSVEAVYQLQSLANKYNQSISETKDLKNQKALNELKEKELAMLEKKKKLSEFDMQAANLRYEIALKQMALEDAQNSKTDMKLTRNAEGNWAYQYVADEDNVTSKQQDLLDAWNSLYRLADEAYKNNMDTLFEIEETYAEKSLEYAEMMNSKNEEIAAKGQRLMDELREWYAKRTQDIADDNASIREQQATATAGVIKSTYENGSDGILDKAESVTEKEKELAEDLKDTYMLDYDKMRDKANDTCEETREDWNSTAQTAINRFYSDPDSVKNSVTAAYNAIVGANTTYQNKLKELQDKAKQNWDQITTNINNAASATDNLAIKTKDYCDQGETDLDKLKGYVDKLKDAWESVTQAIKDAISTIEIYLQKRQEAAAAENSSPGGIGGGGTEGANTGGTGGENNTGSGPSSNPSTSNAKKNTEWRALDKSTGQWYGHVAITRAGAIDWVTSHGWTLLSVSDAEQYVTFTSAQNKGNSGKNMNYAMTKASGGYTGEWAGSSTGLGVPAILHEKEFVLNKDDTENFLAGINTIRDLASVNGSIEKSIMQAVLNTASQFGNIKAGDVPNGVYNSNSDETSNVFNITAEFPNANSVEEIRAAILSLPNYASQVMNSNLR